MSFRITGDPQKVEYAKNLVYELIAEKEMQMFHRGPRGGERGGGGGGPGNFNIDNGNGGAGGGGGFNHGGPPSGEGVEV